MTTIYSIGHSRHAADHFVALLRAQEFVRAQPMWRHPYYWGAWALWGLPD